jgi:hypothetical protein
MSLIMFAALLTLQAQSPASGKTISPNFLPMEIRRAVNEVNGLCKDSGGTPGKSSKLIKFIDLNGDGLTDYVMDLGVYDCQGAASAVSAGQSGSAVTIFIGGPSNTAKAVYHAVAQGVDLVTTAGKPRLYVGVMGADCGQKNAAKKAMVDVEVCMRPLNWKADTQTFVLAPLSEKRAYSIP